MVKSKILIVDDDEDILQAASMVLNCDGFDIKTLQNPDKLMNLISRESFDVVLLDMNYSRDTSGGHEGFYFLKTILQYNASSKVILMTAYGDVEKAVKAIKEGASDFVLKPWNNSKLLSSVKNALDKKATPPIPKEVHTTNSETFIGVSPSMKKVFDTIRKVAPTDVNVLVTGENGTGKQMVANQLYLNSNRNKAPFVSVDLGSLSDTIFESELFGHTKGSFTDAKEDRIGRFEQADGGTIFLDEIGNLSLNQQAKILTAIQSKSISKLGSNKILNLDFRIISATNADLSKMARNQTFRQDLLFRLNTLEINLPPLRERPEDIDEIFFHYLHSFENKYKRTFKKPGSKALNELKKLKWPGNVRELKQKLERAIILSDDTDLDFSFFMDEETEEEAMPLSMNMDEMQKQLVLKALKKSGGNISKAAADLGLTRAALYRRMEKYAI